MQVQPHSPPELLASYAARPDRYDELCQRIGSVVVVRPHWRDFFHGLAAMAGPPAVAYYLAFEQRLPVMRSSLMVYFPIVSLLGLVTPDPARLAINAHSAFNLALAIVFLVLFAGSASAQRRRSLANRYSSSFG